MSAALVPSASSFRAPASGFSDPVFARVAELAHLFAGLVFPPNRQPSAEAGMRRAMSVLHISRPADLLRVFEVPGDARETVLAELTVGESYFFRDSGQLELVVSEILPQRRDRCGPSRPLRVWSAGCASGEEPYTIALMLREQRWPHPARILATDIAQPRLAAARRGRYTRWALRGVSDERITQWFSHTGNYYDLAQGVRDAVEFSRLNLVVDEYPGAGGDEGFDLVLCRNVMIYFDMPTVAHIATGLLASLAPDGWLLLGASDPPLAHLVPCEAIMTPAGVAYRRADASRRDVPLRGTSIPSFGATMPDHASADAWLVHPALSAPLPIAPPSTSWSPTAPPPDDRERGAVETAATRPVPSVAVGGEHIGAESTASIGDDAIASMGEGPSGEAFAALESAYRAADYRTAESIATTLLASPAGDEPRAWIAYVRSVANQGRLHEAGERCARALELHPLTAELHSLHATLLLEAGWFADAAAAARRSIYLDRGLVMGHMLLGDALSRRGDSVGARVAFANALDLLGRLDPEAPVAAADGVHASRLRQIAASRVGSIRTGVS